MADPTPAAPDRCKDCGVVLDPGTAKVFTVCDACWEKAYRKPAPTLGAGAKLVRVSDELLTQLSTEWSAPVRVRIESEDGGLLVLRAISFFFPEPIERDERER